MAERGRPRLFAAAVVTATVLVAAARISRAGPTEESLAPPNRGADPVLIGVWSPEERRAIDESSRRIPDELRVRMPTTVIRDAVACRDRSGWPDDDAIVDDRGRVHLCASSPGSTAADGARQVTQARLFAFDRVAAWSDDPGWRRLNGWRWSLAGGFGPRAANLDPAGFTEPRGQRSPRWDLVTFLSALLMEDAGQDGAIGCRLMSQTAFVRSRLQVPIGPPRCAAFDAWANLDRLADIEVVLAAPSTAMLGSLFGHLFLRLVYRDDDGDDGAGRDLRPAHLSRTVAFLADNDVPFTEDPTYALKGITGRYTASLHERPFLEAYRDYVVVEGRDLRRWRLDLTAAERRALLERIWTVAHGTKVAYYFFRRNCATLMVDLIDDIRATPPDDPPPGWLAAPPATTLEPWASARGADGAPLLQFVPDPIASFEHRARDAARHRVSLEPRLIGALPEPQSAPAVGALRDIHAADAAMRADGYRRLAHLLAGTRAGSAPERRTLRAWLTDSATIETHLSAVANLDAEARADRRRRDRVRAATDEITARVTADARGLRADGRPERTTVGLRLQQAIERLGSSDATARLDGYRALLALTHAPQIDPTLSSRLRLLAVLQSELRYDVVRMKAVPGLREDLLFIDPHQPIGRQAYLAGYEPLLDLPCETHVSAPLMALQQAKQSLFATERLDRARDDPNASTPGPPAPETTAAIAQQEYDAALPHSGIDRFAVLGGVATGAGPARAGLIMSAALYDEQLGDHHRFGFPSDTALVVARSTLFLTLAAGTPAIAAYDTRVIGYRSLGASRAPLPEAGNGRWPLGWELFVTLEGDRARGLTTEPKVGWGLLAPLADRGELTDHLLAGLSVAYAAYFPEAGAAIDHRTQAISTPLSLELRTGLGTAPRYRSWCAVRGWIEPTAALAAERVRLESEAGARAEAHLALGSGTRIGGTTHAPTFIVGAQIVRTTLTFTGASAATEALLSAGFDLR